MLSDSRLFREVIAARLKLEEAIHLVAAAHTIHDLRRRLNGRAARVVVVHASIDGVLGRELVWDAKTLIPTSHLIVVGFRRSRQDLLQWVEAGAVAYLEQDTPTMELLETIREVACGSPSCLTSLLTRVVQHPYQISHLLNSRPGAHPLGNRDLESAIRRPQDPRTNKKSRHQPCR